MLDAKPDDAQKIVARQILDASESIEAELLAEAAMLKKKTYGLIRLHDAGQHRKPPCTLATKNGRGAFSLRLVWVSFTPQKIRLTGGQKVRFTKEIAGRKNGKYPRTTFRYYPEPLHTMLWEIEQEAASLRDRFSYWRDTMTRMGSVAKLLGPRDFPVGRLYIFPSRSCAGEGKMIDFKGVHHPKSVILYAVFFYLRYAVSYRDLEEIMAERGVRVDHATLNRWVVKFSPLIAARAQARKRPTATSWRADETYIKVKGKWTYLYRAVDRDGQTLDFMLSMRRDLAAARRFFRQAIAAHGVPDRVVIDKSGANLAGLQALNVILKFTGNGHAIKVRQIKYLNNILEQDHRFIKRITTPMMGFKAFHSAAATIAGIETAHMIRKGQIPANGTTPFQTFADLAA